MFAQSMHYFLQYNKRLIKAKADKEWHTIIVFSFK